ncbi:MAG TPA: protein phosphatase 2C domain-containing protein [Herpetosiphonaceae bacterium]
MSFLRKLFRRGADEPPVNQPAVAEPAPAEVAVEPEPAPPIQPPAAGAVEPAPVAEEPAAAVDLDGTHELVPTAPLAVTTINSQRGLAAWAARDLGRVRRNNQDSVYAMLMSVPDREHDQPIGLFVVADGMGGHEGGEIASRRAIETVMVSVLEQLVLPAMADEEPGSALQLLMVTALQDANARIYAEARERGSDMGTTCTAALLHGGGLYVAHVGDSRAYLLTESGAQIITADHSTVGRLIAMGQIPPEAAREHPLRNQLYRTVGQHPEVQVDFVYQSTAGASHLLLCSDGLWGMIDDDEIAAVIAESPWPQDACHRLIARANMAGGDDNISAVVVSLPVERPGT